MKITFLSPPLNLGGGTLVMAVYADKLRQRGHEVLVVAPANRRPRLRDLVRSILRGDGLPRIPRRSASHFDGLEVECRILDRCREVLEDDVPDADVVVATWWETAEWMARLSDRKGAKVHFIQGDEPNFARPADRVRATWALPTRKVVCAPWLKELLENQYDQSDVICAPNTADRDIFHAPPRGKQVRPTVGFLYSKAPVKGCDVALAALALARVRLPDLRVLGFGSCPPTPELPLPAGAEYFRSPPKAQIRDIYASCDVWLCGSRSEGYHLPPHEAMACRCPVVSTRVGGPVDLVEDGVSGYLVDVEDPAALADRLVEVLSLSEVRWREMSEAAHARTIGYTWDDAADLFEAALQDAVGRTCTTA